MTAVLSVRTLAEAVHALVGATATTRVLAGGTDLMVEIEHGRTHPDRVVDISRVDELRGVAEEQGGLRIGALTDCNTLIHSELVRARAEMLALAADEVGAEQIKNRASLGGNLGTASPAADLNPVLFALRARVRLVSARGRRELAASEFVRGYRSTARADDELIESIWIPPRSPNERRAFRKVGTRSAQSIAKVVVALALTMHEGRIAELTAAAGSVADRTVLLPSLARELAGREPSAEHIDRAARAAARDDCSPIDDVRSTAEYRRHVLQRLLVVLLGELTSVGEAVIR